MNTLIVLFSICIYYINTIEIVIPALLIYFGDKLVFMNQYFSEDSQTLCLAAHHLKQHFLLNRFWNVIKNDLPIDSSLLRTFHNLPFCNIS